MDGCLECGSALGGRQRKFCSRQCKGSWHNRSHQSCLARQRRGRERKLLLIEMLGFACCHCGYARNSAALEVHHVVPGDKDFALDLRALSNRRWQSILSEVGIALFELPRRTAQPWLRAGRKSRRHRNRWRLGVDG